MHRLRNISPLFVFLSSVVIYGGFYFIVHPGYYSQDVYEVTRQFHSRADVLERIELCILQPQGSVSIFYMFYVLLFYQVGTNLTHMGLFQVVLLSSINSYSWHAVNRYSNKWIAYIVVLAMLASPAVGSLAVWYHRSSLFAFLVYLNLVLVFKMCKTHGLNRYETTLFLLNILAIASLRMDGAVIFAASVSVFLMRPGLGSPLRYTVAGILVFLLICSSIVPELLEPSRKYPINSQIYPAVRRIHQINDTNFSDADKTILNAVVELDQDVFDREAWLRGENYIDYDVFRDRMTDDELQAFKQWSRRYIIRNLGYYIVTQAEVMFHSSMLGRPRAHYYHTNERYRGELFYEKHIAPTDRRQNNDCALLDRRSWFLGDAVAGCWRDDSALIASLALGTSIPSVFLIVWSCIASIVNRRTLAALLPFLLYGALVFALQPQPKAYYWSWLLCSGYFVIFVVGYDLCRDIGAMINARRGVQDRS